MTAIEQAIYDQLKDEQQGHFHNLVKLKDVAALSINQFRSKVANGELTLISQCYDELMDPVAQDIADTLIQCGVEMVEEPNYPQV